MVLRNHPALKLLSIIFLAFVGFFFASSGDESAPVQTTVKETDVVKVKGDDDAASDNAMEERKNLHNQMQNVLSKMAALKEEFENTKRLNKELTEKVKFLSTENKEVAIDYSNLNTNNQSDVPSTDQNVRSSFEQAVNETNGEGVLNLEDYNITSGDNYKSSDEDTEQNSDLDNDPISWIGDDTSIVEKLTGELNADDLFDNSALGGSGDKKEDSKKIQYATLDPEAILFDAFVFDTLFGVSPNQTQSLVPFRFKIELSSENLMTSNIRLPQVRTMRMSGFAVGEWSTSCVKGYITSATFVFQDGMISTVGSASHESEHLGYIVDDYGDPCIRGEKYSSLNEYAAIHGSLSGLSSIADALSNAQFDTVGVGSSSGASQVFNGSQTKLAIGEGASGGLKALSDTFAARYASVRDFVIAKPNTVIVQLSKAINIDYDTAGRKIFNHEFDQQLQEFYESSKQKN